MLAQITVTRTLATDTGQTWTAISHIGGLERWFPIITACEVTGDGEGATRILTLVDGGKIKDRIDLIDHQQKRFCYTRTESPFPVQRYQGTVDVREAEAGNTEVLWTVEVDVEQEQCHSFVELVRNALNDGIKGLEQDLRTLA